MFSVHYLGAVYCISLLPSWLYLSLQGRSVAPGYLGQTLQPLTMGPAPLLLSPALVPLGPARQVQELPRVLLFLNFHFFRTHHGSQDMRCAADCASGEPQKQ